MTQEPGYGNQPPTGPPYPAPGGFTSPPQSAPNEPPGYYQPGPYQQPGQYQDPGYYQHPGDYQPSGNYQPGLYGAYGWSGVPQAPRPGCIPLRPLGLGDILDGSFQVIRRNPRATLGLSAVIAVLQAAVLAGFQLFAYNLSDSLQNRSDGAAAVDTSQVITQASSLFSILVLSAIFGAILTGMLTLVVTDDVLGTRVPLGQLWSRVRPRLPRLVLLSLIIGLVQLVGLVFFIAPGVWLWGIWAVAVPAFMVEDTGVFAALRRSRNLVRGTFWRVWGIRALGVVMLSVIGGILSVPFTIVAAIVSGASFGSGALSGGGLPVAYVLITSIGTILSTTFTAPVRAGIDALLYTDLRMRKEGLDLVLLHLAAQPASAPR